MDALKPPGRERGPSGTSGAPAIVSVPVSDPRYPGRLHHLHDPPAVIHCRGRLGVLDRPTVAIVGSRRSTRYGRRVAMGLADSAARAGWTVVSGMALGVDGAAHQGCLAGSGPTVAVLGNGPDRAHPRAHASLMDRILETGLVVSEYGAGVTPRPHHFPRRNRILAALSDRVVVVEAARRSGALITAGLAAELGREVWAVPGSIFSRNAEGTHRLLVDGATPVASLPEWERSLAGSAPSTAPPGGPSRAEQLALGPQGDEVVRGIWAALEAEGRSLEGLSHTLGIPGLQLLPALTSLELEGWVERAPGPVFHRRVA